MSNDPATAAGPAPAPPPGTVLGPLVPGHHAPLEYHRMLLDDPVRMDAYERAIRALVRPGDVVLDLGCGTGILALLAARRGAARVHGVESAAVGGLARQLVAANGLQDRVFIHRADVLTLPPVEPVDLIVSDFMGRFLEDDGMLPAVEAAARWLKPGGRCCPARIELQLAPVGDIPLWAVELFRHPLYGLDLRPALPYALNYCYHVELDPDALLAPAQPYHEFVPPGPAEPFDRRLRFTVQRSGVLQGVAGWFLATLAPEVLLATGPGVETHWGQYLFPLPPTPAEAGDELEFHLHLDRLPGGPVWCWDSELRRAGASVLRCSLESEQKLGER